MAAVEAGDVVLVVGRAQLLTPREQALRDRLSERLGYTVRVREDGGQLAREQGVGLVVVGCDHASPELRELALPVLVCNESALYDVGMTMARPKTDFGTTDHGQVFIDPDALNHPLAGGITGQHTLAGHRQVQGWGKPGVRALVVATVGGDDKKAVVFAYNKGEPMPAREAVHRRVAFLALGAAGVPLTEQGWMLFDAAVRWAAAGGSATEDEGVPGHWFLKDGTPTRALSTQEYRDWVHEQVERRVWKSVLAIFSCLGLSGLLALYLAISSQIGGKVEDHVAAKLSEMEKTLEIRLAEKATTKVADLVFETSAVAKGVINNLNNKASEIVKKEVEDAIRHVKDKASAIMEEQVGAANSMLKDRASAIMEEQLKDKSTLDRIVAAAISELYQEGKFTDNLLARFRNKQEGESPEVRRLLLQMIAIYATEKHRLTMRDELIKTVLDPEEHENVRILALDMYQPSGGSAEDRKDLKRIFDKLPETPLSPTLRLAYARFVARFADDHAEPLLGWLALRKSLHPETATGVLSGLVRMRALDQGNPRALNLLVDLALDQDRERRAWGVKGLRQIGAEARLNLSAEARRGALEKLRKGITANPEFARELFPVQGSSRSQLLLNLLRPEDEDFLEKDIPGEGARNQALQALLFNWVDVLELEKEQKRLPVQVLDKVYRMRDALYGEGTARVLEYALRHGQAEAADRFFRRLPQLYLGPTYEGEGPEFRGGPALTAAIATDAKSLPPFKGLVDFLVSLEGPGRNEKINTAVTDLVLARLTAYCVSPGHEPAAHGALQAALDASRLKDTRFARPVCRQALVQARLTLCGQQAQANRWDLVLEEYNQLLEMEAPKADWYYQRGLIYLDKLRANASACADFTRAIQLDALQPDYYEKLGNVFLGWSGKAADAERQYLAGLAKLQALEKDAMFSKRQGSLHTKLTLACFLQDDAAGVVKHVQQAMDRYDARQDKAGAQENLGLLLLKQKQWERAFANTTDVKDNLYYNMPWNWIIRYLASRELHSPDAPRIYEEWLRLRMPNDLASLYQYLPDLLKTHLGVISVQEGALQTKLPLVEGKYQAVHPFVLEAGKTYVIDMESVVIDSYLILRDPSGKEVTRDDDSGGGRNARVEYRPSQTGMYQIIATSFMREAQGAYAVVIRALPGAEAPLVPADIHFETPLPLPAPGR